MRKEKEYITHSQSLKKIEVKRTNGKFRKGYHYDKPKGAISLKTRIINNMLGSYFEKKVEGGKLLRNLPQMGNRGINKYLDTILTLIKPSSAEGEKSGTIIYNIVLGHRKEGSKESSHSTLREDRG